MIEPPCHLSETPSAAPSADAAVRTIDASAFAFPAVRSDARGCAAVAEMRKRIDAFVTATAFEKLALVHDATGEVLTTADPGGKTDRCIGALQKTLATVLPSCLQHLRQVRPPLATLNRSRLDLVVETIENLALLHIRKGLPDALKGRRIAQSAVDAWIAATNLLAQRIALDWQFYRPADAQLWLRLLALVALSDRAGFLQRHGRHVDLGGDPHTDRIDHAFVRLALLSVSNPAALPHGAAASLIEWVRGHEPDLQRALDAPIPSGRPIGIVDASRAAAPILGMQPRIAEGLDHQYWFDLEPLLVRLQDASPDARWNPGQAGIDEHLVRAWTRSPERRYSRIPETTRAAATLGVEAVGDALARHAAEQRANATPRRAGAYAGEHTDSTSGRGRSIAVFELPDSGHTPEWSIEQPIRNDLRSNGSLPAPNRNASPQHKGSALQARPTGSLPLWTIQNRSAGGLRIRIEQKPNATIMVGELIGICETGETTHWDLGIVRWLTEDDDGLLAAGIELLGDEASPGMAFAYCNQRARDAGTRALLLPSTELIDETTLALPPRVFASGDRVVLRVGKVARVVELLSPVRENVYFHWTTFRYSGDPLLDTAPSLATGSPARPDDIWKPR